MPIGKKRKRNLRSESSLRSVKKVRITERYKDLRRQRNQSRFKTLSFKIKNLSISKPSLSSLKILGTFLIAFVIVLLALIPLNLKAFNIKNINVKSNTHLSKDIFQNFENKNIFKINTKDIKTYAYENIPNLETIYIRKVLPNSLEIEISQNRPLLAMINFDSYYIIGENYQPIKREQLASFNMTSYEQEILNGLGDINASYIKERYLATIDEEKRSEVNWKKVPVEEKQKIFNELVLDLQNRLNAYFQQSNDIVHEKYNDLKIVNFYQYSHDQEYAKVKERLQFSSEIMEFLEKNNFNIAKSEWYENFFYRIFTQDDKVLIFSVRRNLEEQKKDVLIAKKENLFENSKSLDFRTNNFSLTN